MIRLINARVGLATNSSSSHSFIFLKKYIKGDDIPVYDGERVDSDFGRESFTLSTAVQKQGYLLGLLLNNFKYTMPDWALDLMYKELIGKTPYNDSYGVDHQSVIVFPRDWNNPSFVDIDFWNDFKDYILRSGVVILGGSDEDYEPHELIQANPDIESFKFPNTDIGYERNLVARKDRAKNIWTLFNRETGGKMRIAMTDYPPLSDIQSYKADFFELIDLKISQYCDIGCDFCYMGSTVEGKHADTARILNLINLFSYMKVFEIALGGGEPTYHPDFVKILKYAKEHGVVANFTTKSLKWMKDDLTRKEITENCGGFAYSVSNLRDLEKLISYLNVYDIPSHKVGIHIVMGTVSLSVFEKLLQMAGKNDLRVTLLGFKETGRGKGFKIIEYEWWIDIINKVIEERYYPKISIDTTLAAQYHEKLQEILPEWSYHIKDGLTSAYFDAVEGRFGASSYDDTEKMIKYEGNYYFSDMYPDRDNELFRFMYDEYAKFV